MFRYIFSEISSKVRKISNNYAVWYKKISVPCLINVFVGNRLLRKNTLILQ